MAVGKTKAIKDIVERLDEIEAGLDNSPKLRQATLAKLSDDDLRKFHAIRTAELGRTLANAAVEESAVIYRDGDFHGGPMMLIFFDLEDDAFGHVPCLTRVLKVSGAELRRRKSATNEERSQA